uniref:Uncharacterized protein n=1 Tax=Lygus hesperus TaxID=30085 RepID=A0A0A9YVB7_LYGHE
MERQRKRISEMAPEKRDAMREKWRMWARKRREEVESDDSSSSSMTTHFDEEDQSVRKIQLEKQDISMPVYSVMGVATENRTRHTPLLPNSIRCVMCATSNGGKTNLMLNLLYSRQGLKFENIYLFSKTLHQPQYNQLSNILSTLPEIGFYKYGNSDDVPIPSETMSNSIMILDDTARDKQDRIRMFFSMGRHNHIDSFYLAQSYCRIPKHLIRDCANLIIVFRQDTLNMRKIYDDHVNVDMSFNKFSDMCSICWENTQYGFLVIDKECSLFSGRYRQGCDTFIIP